MRHIPGCEAAKKQEMVKWVNEDENVGNEMNYDEMIAAVKNNTNNIENENEFNTDKKKNLSCERENTL